MSTGQEHKIAILGAGLVGRLLAWRLARQGRTIVLYDAGGPLAEQSAARVAAAMLAPLAESVIADAETVQLGRQSLALWPQWLSELGSSIFFQQAGSLIVHHPQDRAEMLHFRQHLSRYSKQFPLDEQAQELDSKQLAKLEPELAERFPSALYLPKEGQLDNRALLAVLGKELERLGVELHWHTYLDFPPPTRWVIDCRGIGAQPVWRQLRGVRGEVLRLFAPEVKLQRPVRLLHPRYPLYIAPKPNHEIVIGATEIESQDQGPVTVRSALELLSTAMVVHPGFAEARIQEFATGLRPALPDNRPRIRWGNGQLQINGLYRHGYLIAPAVVEAALQLFDHLQRQLQPPQHWLYPMEEDL